MVKANSKTSKDNKPPAKKAMAGEEKAVPKKESTAKLRYLKIAPRKTRLVANSIKGLKAIEAEAELLYRPQRAAGPILKLLRSAISNALNSDLNKDNLYISNITVDGGPMLKRMRERARGRGAAIQKKMSHINLVLSEKDDSNKKTIKYKAPTIKKIKSDKKIKSTISK